MFIQYNNFERAEERLMYPQIKGTTVDVSQPCRDNVADKGIAAKSKRSLAYSSRNRRRRARGLDDWKTILEVLHRDCKKSGGG